MDLAVDRAKGLWSQGRRSAQLNHYGAAGVYALRAVAGAASESRPRRSTNLHRADLWPSTPARHEPHRFRARGKRTRPFSRHGDQHHRIGKLKLAVREGKRLPEGWASIGRAGRQTIRRWRSRSFDDAARWLSRDGRTQGLWASRHGRGPLEILGGAAYAPLRPPEAERSMSATSVSPHPELFGRPVPSRRTSTPSLRCCARPRPWTR